MVAQGLRNAIFKSGGGFLGGSTAPIMDLYRSICREIPRVLTIYDVDMDPAVARRKVNELFRKNGHLQDPEVIKIVVSKGYMELEETVLQFKQRTHLMRLLGAGTVKYRPAQGVPQATNFYFRNAANKVH